MSFNQIFLFQKSRCKEADKKKYSFSQGGRVNPAFCWWAHWSLISIIKSKNHLTMSLLFSPRIAALLLVPPPVPNFNTLERTFLWNRKLEISMHCILECMQLIEPLEYLLVFVMKFPLVSSHSSSLQQISRSLVFISHVTLLFQNICLKSNNLLCPIKIKNEYCLIMLKKHVILSLLSNMWFTVQEDCNWSLSMKHSQSV